MDDQHLASPPAPTSGRPPGAWLSWVAAVVGVGAVAVLVYVATLLVGSARESRAVEEAGRNLPAVGTYALRGAELTQEPSELWRLTATQAQVRPDGVRVLFTWTNAAGQELPWSCPGPVPLDTWRSASVEVPGAAAGATASRCRRDAPAAADVAPDATVQDWQEFPRDGAWGAGPTRLTAQPAQDGAGAAVDTDPAVTFVVDLAAAEFTAD
ncbi:hypothetical protein [Kineococcus sp. SYSU DK001]|uniref:hypothetical protein n=1 Tax=Kineococcus sp. SYSU DK001 TaxID=3383122 RepID=UPI003D7EAB24